MVSKSTNTGDALVVLARDTVHAHLNVVSELADMFVPCSLGQTIRHPSAELFRRSVLPTWRRAGVEARRVSGGILAATSAGTAVGPTDVEEKGDSFVLTFEVPGWGSGDLDVEVGKYEVRVHGRKEAAVRGSSEDTETVEYDAYWSPPSDIELASDDVHAQLADGILKVTVGKPADQRRRKVEIK